MVTLPLPMSPSGVSGLVQQINQYLSSPKWKLVKEQGIEEIHFKPRLNEYTERFEQSLKGHFGYEF